MDHTGTYRQAGYRGIHADVIVYILAHLHTTLRIEKKLVRYILTPLNTWLKF